MLENLQVTKKDILLIQIKGDEEILKNVRKNFCKCRQVNFMNLTPIRNMKLKNKVLGYFLPDLVISKLADNLKVVDLPLEY